MNTKQNTEYHYRSAYASNEDIGSLALSAWSIAQAVLFSGQLYTQKEKQKILMHIRSFLLSSHDPYQAYLEFCQRIMLARHYTYRNSNGLLYHHPARWFRQGYSIGFDKTKPMYERLIKRRKKDPLWKKEWKALAEAIHEMHESPTCCVFLYWQKWFLNNNASAELNILRHLRHRISILFKF